MIVAVAGNPSIDKLFEVDRLIPGDIHRPRDFVSLPGGKGIHVAQVATALGAHAVVVSLLAGHAGRWVAEALAAENVDGRFAWTAGETRSSLSVADRETGRLTEFYEDGGPINDGKWREVESIVSSLLPDANWLALAGSLPPGTEADGYSRLIEMAHEAGVSTALDSRGDALEHTLKAQPTFVKINVHEAGELLGRAIEGSDEVRRAGAEIRAAAGGEGHAVAITLGEDGMVVVDPSGAAWRGCVAVRGSYPVGSGDSVLAGMLAALDGDASWAEAIALGLGAAAANAETPGAGRIQPDRARSLAEMAEIEPLSS